MDTIELMEKIKAAPVERVFGARQLGELEWLWMDRSLFADVILLADEHLDEDDVDGFLRIISDEDFLELLEPRMLENGFLRIEPHRFHKLDPTQKSFDKNTTLFIGRRFLMKKMIGFSDGFDWMLKAMALDVKGYSERPLMDIFKEHFEENGRLLEEMAVKGRVDLEEWSWIFDEETNTLVTTYQGQIIAKWSGPEAIHDFGYRIRGRDV